MHDLQSRDDRRAIFVGGPIQHALSGNSMSSSATEPINVVHDIVRSLGFRLLSAHVAEAFGAMTAKTTPEEVSVRDFHWMRECSAFIATLPLNEIGALIRSDGTHVELGWACAMGKPIIVVSPTAAWPQLSHLVKGLGTVAHVQFVDLTLAFTQMISFRETVGRCIDTCFSPLAPDARPLPSSPQWLTRSTSGNP